MDLVLVSELNKYRQKNIEIFGNLPNHIYEEGIPPKEIQLTSLGPELDIVD